MLDTLQTIRNPHFVKRVAHEDCNSMPENNFGDRIRRARLRFAGLIGDKVSQEDVALVVGVAQSTAGRWEAGVQEPDLATIARVADELWVSPEWLAFGRGKMAPVDEEGRELVPGDADATTFRRAVETARAELRGGDKRGAPTYGRQAPIRKAEPPSAAARRKKSG